MVFVAEIPSSSSKTNPYNNEEHLIDNQFDVSDLVLSILELNLVIVDFLEQSKNGTDILNIWNSGIAKFILPITRPFP